MAVFAVLVGGGACTIVTSLALTRPRVRPCPVLVAGGDGFRQPPAFGWFDISGLPGWWLRTHHSTVMKVV